MIEKYREMWRYEQSFSILFDNFPLFMRSCSEWTYKYNYFILYLYIYDFYNS